MSSFLSQRNEIKAPLAKKPNAAVYSYPGQNHAFSRHTTEASPGMILPCSEQRNFGKRDDGNGNGAEYRRLSDH